MSRITLAGAIALASTALGHLGPHDPTGTVGNGACPMPEQLKALEPTIANAGATIVRDALPSTIGPEAALIEEAAVPLLRAIIEAAEARVAEFATRRSVVSAA